MQSNISENFKKIVTALNQLDKIPKSILKYGTRVFLGLLFIGTVLLFYNATQHSFELDLIAKGIIKSSFAILAEVVIGSLLMDYVFRK